MKLAEGDQVEWADGHPDRGVLIEVRKPKPSRGEARSWVQARVRWESGATGWTVVDALRRVDVVTRLGDLVRQVDT